MENMRAQGLGGEMFQRDDLQQLADQDLTGDPAPTASSILHLNFLPELIRTPVVMAYNIFAELANWGISLLSGPKNDEF